MLKIIKRMITTAVLMIYRTNGMINEIMIIEGVSQEEAEEIARCDIEMWLKGMA